MAAGIGRRRKRPALHVDRQSAKDARYHWCSRCFLMLPVTSFRRDSRGYWRSHSIACSREVNQEWRARHHDELLARRREQRRIRPIPSV